MTPEKLLTLFKYYHGEEESPYEQRSNEDMWWFGEKMIYDQTMEHPGFFSKFRQDLEDALRQGHCSGRLVDETLSLDQRTIIYYLGLWHGKWFPFDDWSVIESY